MNSQQLAQEISKESKSSFYYAFSLLPPLKRDAMNIVYAFCRKTDDIVDENSDSVEKRRAKLEMWKSEFQLASLNNSSIPLLNTVSATMNQFSIDTKLVYDLIRGMEMDLIKDRYQTFEELQQYCYCVASTVGLMCIEIFGYKNQSAKDFAYDLGMALQLTNIIRDVKKDAEQGRIYLPLEDLARFNYSEEELFAGVYNENFVSLMRYQAKRAEEYFNKATAALVIDDKRAMFAARAMQHIYFRVLERLYEKNFDVFSETINVNKYEKLGIALGVWVKYKLVY